MSMLVAELERNFLPDDAVFVEAIRVKHNFRKVREKVLRRERFASRTFLSDWFKIEEKTNLPDYLCLVRYSVHRHASEILTSLQERPFEAAMMGRFCDLCREHPERQFDNDIVFLGTYWWLGRRVGQTIYPAWKQAPDGVKEHGSAISWGRFKPNCWLFALQPTTEEVAEILERIILIEDRRQELVAIH